MTRQKRLILALVILGCSAAGLLLAYALISPKPGVTEENYYRLRAGMTKEQIDAILGSPGVHLSGRLDERHSMMWKGDGTMIFAHFIASPDARMVEARFDRDDGTGLYVAEEDKGPLATLRRLLKW